MTVVTFTGGNIASFDYAYDPNGNGDLGQLVAHLRNSAGNAVYTGTVNLYTGDKTLGAAIDGFGAAEGAISDTANYVDMYFDDALYRIAEPPVVHWKFDESSGSTASDATGNGNTGTLYNSPSWVTGQSGNALSFDGSNDYVYRSSLTTTVTGDASISLWLNYTNANTGLRALNLGGWQVRFSEGKVGWDNGGGPSHETHSTNAYNNGEWHHVVFTRASTNYKMYIDKVADKTDTGTASSYSWLYVGATNSSSQFYAGKVDDVRIYDYALTQSDVNTVYESVAPPPDTTPPTPNPMTFATAPYATGTTSIAMVATTATDTSGVEYYFTCTAGGGHSSSWQSSTSYSDTGLSPNTQYTYTVKARDLSANHNETTASSPASATTQAADTTPPTPNPMTFATAPHATGTTSIAMVATTATDTSGVEYFFTCTAGGGHSSSWQSSTSYSDTGLSPNTQYTYTVKARDLSANYNETTASSPASATTDSAAMDPPTVHWKFDEGSGITAIDATGNGNTGTLYNSPTWVAGKYSNALSFDGSNDYVYRSSLSTTVTGDCSISLWLNYTNANTGLRALNLGGWQVRFSSGKVGWDNTGGPSSETYSTNAYNDGAWHHVVFTRTGTNYKMYIDKSADSTGTGTAPSYSWLYVGATNSSSQFYAGKVDDVRIYDYSLTQSNVNTVYEGSTSDVTLLEDGFESNFDKWTDGGATDWDRDSSSKHSGTYSAECDSAENDLISDNLDTSGKSSITINFWYYDAGIDDDDNAYLQLYDGSAYDNKFEVGNTSPESTWYQYTTTIYNSGGDAQYFISNFRIKFEGTSLDSGEYLRIDDVVIVCR
jgi:hypothetical protein